MRFAEISIRQPKSSIKAGEGLECGTYKFFTSGVSQSKFLNEALYHGPALIFGTGGSPSVHYCEEDFSTSTDCLVYYPSDESIDFYCAYLFFKSHIYLLEKGFRGAGLKHIKKDYIENIEINWPNEDRRNVINTTSKKIDFLAAKRKEQLDKLNVLSSALFYEMFGNQLDGEDPLVDLCEKKEDIKCGPFGTQLSKSEYQSSGVAVWGIPQINSKFGLPPTDYVSEQKAKKLEGYSVVPGDIVMSRKGNVGQCCVFPQELDKGIIHSDVLRIRLCNESANPVFMMYQLHLSELVKRQIMKVSSGAIMQGVNVTKLKNIRVAVPPLPLQQEFADKVANIEKQKELIQNSLQKLELLKNSLMQQYFA